jgi:pectate lyase
MKDRKRLKRAVMIFLGGWMACSMVAQVNADLPAFPQAEGFGAYALGGRGGKVIFVDNLKDDGPGSLRAAVADPDPRIVIFRVSGTIELKSPLVVTQAFITIAGHTAPGDGICLKNFPLMVNNTNDVIVRGIRIRPGVESIGEKGSTDGISVYQSRNVIIDHCTASWSTDEIVNTNNRNYDITVQWCIFSESLNYSTQQREHGYAATLGGTRTSFHHNLLAHNKGRNPSIGGGDRDRRSGMDIRNNVVYNWISRVCDGKPHTINFVANYYRPGPATPPNNRKVVAEIQNSEVYGFDSQWYIEDNFIEEFPGLTENNWSGAVRLRSGCSMEKNRQYTPFESANYVTRDAAVAYLEVLDHAGVIVPRRDEVDQRVIKEVRTGTATFGNGIIDKVEEVGGWPELRTYDVPGDTDKDGMPDAWETEEGLNIHDPSDRFGIKEGEVYDNLERYLNGLASDKAYLLPPVNLKANVENDAEVALSWKDITKDELGFVIQRAGADGTFITIATVEANVSSYTDKKAGPVKNAAYRVFAVNNELTSVPSKPARR